MSVTFFATTIFAPKLIISLSGIIIFVSGIYQTINIIACCYDENDDNDLTANSDETDGNNFNSKSAADPSAHLPHYPRPNVDIILSLRDPFYRSVMTKFYQSRETIATKMHRRTKAKEVLLLFKNRNTTRGETLLEEDDATATIAITPVRFFKTTRRYKRSETLVEVNETAALRGEYIIRFFALTMFAPSSSCRFLESSFCVRNLSKFQCLFLWA